jgi:tetratricopeptide (TPR) repeat protein
VNSIVGDIAFGLGVADVVCHLALWLMTLVCIINWATNRTNGKRLLISNVIFTILLAWMGLSATLWRGTEYGWNGEVFYPSVRAKAWQANSRIRWQSEIDSLKVIIKEKPGNSNALVRIGVLKSLLDEGEKSLRYLEEALERGNTSIYTRSTLAREYENNKMKDKAIEQYEEILRIDSLNASAKLNRRRLKDAQ